MCLFRLDYLGCEKVGIPHAGDLSKKAIQFEDYIMEFSCKRIREGVEESMSIITTMSSYGKDKLILGYKSGYVAVSKYLGI